jgi:hypothetical protein
MPDGGFPGLVSPGLTKYIDWDNEKSQFLIYDMDT